MPAFGTGMVFNLMNLSVLLFLVLRRHGSAPRLAAA